MAEALKDPSPEVGTCSGPRLHYRLLTLCPGAY